MNRILHFDPHPVVHYAFAEWLNSQPDLQLLQSVTTPGELTPELIASADLILTESRYTPPAKPRLGPAGYAPPGLIQQARSDPTPGYVQDMASFFSRVKPPVVIFSVYAEPADESRAYALGAKAFLSKSTGQAELFRVIRGVLRGESYRPSSSARIQPFGSGTENLTNRQLQVARHIALGLSNREIGNALGISAETVKEHIREILKKLGVASRTEVAVLLARQGIT